ncbi:MAG: sulfatase family protein [Opitutales bacterium]
MPQDRPNILLIVTDQQPHDALSCAGNDNLHTPFMDQIARQGVRFTSAYCTHPVCTPSRASIYSGRHPVEHGFHSLKGEWPEALKPQEMGSWFADRGYTCAYAGKWHVPEIAMPATGFGWRKICGFDDNQLARSCTEFFQEHDGAQPFLLAVNFDNPHNICEHGRNQNLPWGEVDRGNRDTWPNLPANFARDPYEPEAIGLQERDPGLAGARRRLAFSPDRWREYRHVLFRLCEKVDTEISRILEGLKVAGYERDTWVIFTSDHGEMAGAHQLGHKQTAYDESARVPLIISGPGVDRPGRTVDNLVSNGLDLMPTLCSLAGIDAPAGLAGNDLSPWLADASDSGPDHDELVIEFNNGSHSEGRAVLTDAFKYVCYKLGENREQLFDRGSDPGEQVNLAIEGRYREVLQDMRQRLHAWCLNSEDFFGQHYSQPHGTPEVPGVPYQS